MTKTGKIIVAIIIFIIIIGIGWWIMDDTSGTPVPNQTATTTVSTQTQPTNTVSASDSSDASIGSDMSNIDAQMTGVTSDSAQADEALK